MCRYDLQWACISINAANIPTFSVAVYIFIIFIEMNNFYCFVLDRLKGSRAIIGTFVRFIFLLRLLLLINVRSNLLTIVRVFNQRLNWSKKF